MNSTQNVFPSIARDDDSLGKGTSKGSQFGIVSAMGTSAGMRSFGGSKKIGGFARRQQ